MNLRASNLERISLCPGSAVAESGLPDRTSDIGEAGRRAHEQLANHFLNGLDDDYDDLVATYIREAHAIIGEYTKGQGYTLRVEEGIESLDGYTGHPDLVCLWSNWGENCALILDWKTGWLEQEPSQSNLQLRAYAVLAALAHHRSTVFVALLQRNAKTVITKYELNDLIQAREELLGIVRSVTPWATRTPGEKQCRYCRAVGMCPEARAAIPEILSMVAPLNTPLPVLADDRAIKSVVTHLSGEQLAYIHERKGVVDQVMEATTAEIKSRLAQDPKAVPGLALKPGAKRRTVVSAMEASERLAKEVPINDFLDCCSVRIGDLEIKFRGNTGATAAQAAQALSERLDGVIEETRNQPSIVKAK